MTNTSQGEVELMGEHRSPITRFGGKYYLRNWLRAYMPKGYKVYCEVFGGAAHLLFGLERGDDVIEVYNDADGVLANFFRVLRDEKKFCQLMRMLEVTEYGVSVFNEAKSKLEAGDFKDDVEQAWAFFVLNGQSRLALGGAFSRARCARAPGNDIIPLYIWNIRLARLGLAHDRVRNLVVECMDFREFIPFYDSPGTFFYCDPPYVHEARSSKSSAYARDMGLQDHEELVELLLQVQGKVLLSGYRHEVYEPLERAGWCVAEKVAFSRSALASGSKQKFRTEVIWFNYDLPSVEPPQDALQPTLEDVL